LAGAGGTRASRGARNGTTIAEGFHLGQETASPRGLRTSSSAAGAMTDQTVTDIWIDALGYVRDYVARTLNKS
jgi:hypothetical protein